MVVNVEGIADGIGDEGIEGNVEEIAANDHYPKLSAHRPISRNPSSSPAITRTMSSSFCI
jgi:hypothetical protein